MANILIIDDEREVGNFLFHLLTSKGFDITIGYSGKDFQQLAPKKNYDLAMIDVKLPDINGIELLKKLKQLNPLCKVIIMTGYSTVKTAVEAIKFGANDYIEKPFDNIDEVESLVEQLLVSTQANSQHEMHQLAENLGLIVGNSTEMNHLITLAYKIAKKNVNVLIEGETGTGKEVLAHFIHQANERKSQPFVGINCGAISESLLESELFGHEKGAFTGAVKDRKGIFEIANKGTLFLDEIGEASLSTQVKLLRVLETGEFMRIGDESVRRTNTRIIAASHVNLAEAVENKTFREDLLYRIDVVKLIIPPLRNRKEDIPLFLSYYLKKYKTDLSFSEDSLKLMQEYSWPGNIRELVNMVKLALTLAEGETAIITPSYLPEKIRKECNSSILEQELPSMNKKHNPLAFDVYINQWVAELKEIWQEEESSYDQVIDCIKQLEITAGKAFVMRTLQETMGNRGEAAKKLNISIRKLRYILNEKGHSIAE
ncbi:sigma-54-dependent transcriptional regulator [Heyndrickxia sp. NPDC080065]|uniref:sigma-54-dependent transcriptional regulator n=1 Tax=Heyndrickxia sp. NPDC080065 TaxID=3390568 RepID=UPI003CFD0560